MSKTKTKHQAPDAETGAETLAEQLADAAQTLSMAMANANAADQAKALSAAKTTAGLTETQTMAMARLGLGAERLAAHSAWLTESRLSAAVAATRRGLRAIRVMAVIYALAGPARETMPLPLRDLAALAQVPERATWQICHELARVGLLTRQGPAHGAASWQIPETHSADQDTDRKRYAPDLSLARALAWSAHGNAGSAAMVAATHAAQARQTTTPLRSSSHGPGLAERYGLRRKTLGAELTHAAHLGLISKQTQPRHPSGRPRPATWQTGPIQLTLDLQTKPKPKPETMTKQPTDPQSARAPEPDPDHLAELDRAAQARRCHYCQQPTDLGHAVCPTHWRALSPAAKDHAAATAQQLRKPSPRGRGRAERPAQPDPGRETAAAIALGQASSAPTPDPETMSPTEYAKAVSEARARELAAQN